MCLFIPRPRRRENPLAETLLTDQMDDPEQLVIEQENFTAFWEQLREQLSALERQVLDAYLEGKTTAR